MKIGAKTGGLLGGFLGGIAGGLLAGPLGIIVGAAIGSALFATLGGAIGYAVTPRIMLWYMKKNINKGKAREDILESMNNLAAHIDMLNMVSENFTDPQDLPSEQLPGGSRGNTGSPFSNAEMERLLGQVGQLPTEQQVSFAAVVNYRALVQGISRGAAPRTIEVSDTHRAESPTPKPGNLGTVRLQRRSSETFV